jgi:hypothetical protein
MHPHWAEQVAAIAASYHKTGKRLLGMAEDIDLIVIVLGPKAIAWTHRL